MTDNPWPPVVVALGFLAIVGIILIITLPRGGDADSFLKVWGGVGTVIGVVTGAVPSFFFKRAADNASTRAQQAEKRADTTERAALTLATAVDANKHPGVVDAVKRELRVDR